MVKEKKLPLCLQMQTGLLIVFKILNCELWLLDNVATIKNKRILNGLQTQHINWMRLRRSQAVLVRLCSVTAGGKTPIDSKHDREGRSLPTII